MRRRLFLLTTAFVALLLVLLLIPPAEERLPPLTVYSAAPAGGKGLRLWLDELGYDVSTLEATPYRVPAEAGTLLILQPIIPFSTRQMEELERWVRSGGTLILAVEGLVAEPLVKRFGFGLRAVPIGVDSALPATAGLLDPAIGEVLVEATEALILPTSGATPLLSAQEHVIAATAPADSGRLVLLSAPKVLSNQSLRRVDNARFALSIVGTSGRGNVVFDELHHGYGAVEQRNLMTLLFERAWGHAALYAAMLACLYLVLRGRRFGRAVPIVVSRGRSLSEYVTSLAGPYRAGGKRAFVAEHFRRRLRRELALDLGLPGDAPDEQIVTRAAVLRQDPAAALRGLALLARSESLSEGEMVKVVRESEQALPARRADARAGSPR